jgi:hypothetical protein
MPARIEKRLAMRARPIQTAATLWGLFSSLGIKLAPTEDPVEAISLWRFRA